MTEYLLIPLIEVLMTVFLMIVLLARGKRHVARKPFFLFLLSMGLWGFFIFMMRSVSSMESALIWEKLVLSAILSASLFFYRFAISLTGARPRKSLFYSVHALYLICLVLVPTGLVVSDMQMMWYGKAPVVGLLFAPYLLAAYAPLVLGLVMLVKHLKQSRDVDERTRDHYIVAGMIAMFIGGTTDYLPPLGINMYPLGIIGNIVFCLMATIAMLRYDLLDVKVVLRRGISLVIVGVFLLCIFVGQIFLLGAVFQTALSPISLTIFIVSILSALIVITILQPIMPLSQRIVDRWFFRERYDHLETLKRFTAETKDIVDLRQLASSLVTAVANGMQSRFVCLLLPSPPSGAFTTHSYYGKNGSGGLSFAATSLLALTMRYHDGPLDIGHMEVSPTLSIMTDGEKTLLQRNQVELLIPVKARDELTGILLVSRKFSEEDFSIEDRLLLQKIAQDVAADIENALAYESMQQEHGALLEAIDGIIHAMSLVVEARDPYTAGHQRRVAEIACAIGRAMHLPEWSVKGIRIAGLLHDVGKLSVPAEILSKPGKLNNSEFDIIKSHSKVSYDILEMINFPWPVREAVLQHHERLDGSGYPDGLSGEEIILEARILGVADVVEAISSHRPYRPALGLEYAMREILSLKNTLYDATVVDACLRLFENKEFALEQYMTPAGVSA